MIHITRGDNIKKYLNSHTKVLITKDTFKSYFFRFLWDKKNIVIFDIFKVYAQNLYKELINSEKTYNQVVVEIVENKELGYSINHRIIKVSSSKSIYY